MTATDAPFRDLPTSTDGTTEATLQALTTLALCHHGQIVALVTAVEAMLAVMSKRERGMATRLDAHLAVCAGDHRDPHWHPDQRLSFDNQLKRLHEVLAQLIERDARQSRGLTSACPPLQARANA